MEEWELNGKLIVIELWISVLGLRSDEEEKGIHTVMITVHVSLWRVNEEYEEENGNYFIVICEDATWTR